MNKISYGIIVFLMILLILFKENIFYILTKITILPFNNIENIYESRLKKDYEEALDYINLESSYNYEYLYSKILFHNLYDYKNHILIYNGENYGVKENMLVLDKNGLLGVINKVYKSTSEVSLINDKKINLSVNVSNCFGILNCSNQCNVSGLTCNDKIQIGDEVFTSGLGHIIGGIPVGRVINISKSNLETQAEIELYAESKTGDETAFSKPYILTGELNEMLIYLSELNGVEIPLGERTRKIDGRILTKAIRDEFDLHEYYLDDGKKYASINERDVKTRKTIRYYPELIKTDEYDKILNSDEYKEYLNKKEKVITK